MYKYLAELPRGLDYLILAVLLCVSFFLTYYYQHVLYRGTVFTHFYYVPIIFACIWWKKRGFAVVMVLSLALLTSHYLAMAMEPFTDDLFRIAGFVLVAFVCVLLSESVEASQKRELENLRYYETMFYNAGSAMAILEDDASISMVNGEFEKLTGYSFYELENDKSLFALVVDKHIHKTRTYYYHVLKDKFYTDHLFVKLNTKAGKIRDVKVLFNKIPGSEKVLCTVVDLSHLKEALETQRQLKAELADALAKVLSGYLPICAWCKRVRDESGNWSAVETYISKRTSADFTHTICPECAKSIYPKYDQVLMGDNKKPEAPAT